MESATTIKTVKAKRYLTQMCKYLHLKVPVGFEDSVGWVELPMGKVCLKASDHDFTMNLTADDNNQLTQLEKIMKRYLECQRRSKNQPAGRSKSRPLVGASD